jgi:hypothetical protein
MRKSNTLEILEKELDRWPGVNHRAEHAGRHPRLWVEFHGEKRFVPFSTTQVGKYGLMQKLTQMRRVLKEIGATRD